MIIRLKNIIVVVEGRNITFHHATLLCVLALANATVLSSCGCYGDTLHFFWKLPLLVKNRFLPALINPAVLKHIWAAVAAQDSDSTAVNANTHS